MSRRDVDSREHGLDKLCPMQIPVLLTHILKLCSKLGSKCIDWSRTLEAICIERASLNYWPDTRSTDSTYRLRINVEPATLEPTES